MDAEQLLALDGVNRSVRVLSETIRWGTGAEHPGLGDTAHTTAHHMGALLNYIRDWHAAGAEPGSST